MVEGQRAGVDASATTNWDTGHDMQGPPARADDLEVEIKLTAPLPVLKAAFAALDETTPTQTDALVSVYFDTPDRRLQKRGYTLRVRDRGGRFLQTVKADNASPVRLELETEVAGLAPDVNQLRTEPLRNVLGAVFPDDLEACFGTYVERRTRRVIEHDPHGRTSDVEVALDCGELRTTEGEVEPIAELEIEAKAGGADAVFRTARKLVDRGATRLVVRSKAARGFALVDGTAPPATKAAPVRLERDMAFGRALGLVFESCFAQWWANQDSAFDGRDPSGVHQLRVGLRRLRAAVSSFGPYLAPTRLEWLKTEARAVMTELGSARDLDVFAGELLPPVAAARPNDPAIGVLRVAAGEARDRAYGRVRALLASRRYTTFLLDFGAWLERRGWLADADRALHEAFDAPVGPVIDRLLARRAKVVRKRGKGFSELTTEERHQVRIALKKLRYVVDFGRDLYPRERVDPYISRLQKLQDAFGHLNDLAAAEALLREMPHDEARFVEGRGLVLGWYAHAAGAPREELLERWKAFSREEPFWCGQPAC